METKERIEIYNRHRAQIIYFEKQLGAIIDKYDIEDGVVGLIDSSILDDLAELWMEMDYETNNGN